MKKLIYTYLWLLLGGGFLFLHGCGEIIESPTSTITLNPSIAPDADGRVSVSPGETVDIRVSTSGTGEIIVESTPSGSFTNGNNTVRDGETVGFIVPVTAIPGDIYTLTFSLDGGVATEQLEVFVIYGSVVDVIVNEDAFSTLEDIITILSLEDDLSAGPFTIFAPNDAAFAEIDLNSFTSDEIIRLLQYHILSASLGSGQLETGYYTTLSGESVYLEVDFSTITVNGIPIVTTDLTAENGVVHEISEVLLPQVTSYEAFLLAAPTSSATSETFFSTSDGTLYSYDDVVSTNDPVSADIDLGYFYGATLNATLASPDEYPQEIYNGLAAWGTRNSTVFRYTSLTETDFDAIGSGQGDAVELGFEGGASFENEGRANGLAAGDVIAFSTTNNRFGLIKVVEVIGTNGFDDGIQIEVKVTN